MEYDSKTVGAGEAAQELGVAYPRLMRMVYRGELDARLIDGRWRVSVVSLRNYIRQPISGNASDSNAR
jgi:hypothetical protein